MDKLQIVEMIPFNSFKEKINITRKYDGKAKLEIIDNKFVYLEREIENENMGTEIKIATYRRLGG